MLRAFRSDSKTLAARLTANNECPNTTKDARHNETTHHHLAEGAT